MDYKRLFLYAALSLSGIMLFEAWQRDYPSTHHTTAQAQQHQPRAQVTDEPKEQEQDVPTLQDKAHEQEPVALAVNGRTHGIPENRVIRVKTDVYLLDIDKKGGDIIALQLLKYPQSLADKSTYFQLFSQHKNHLYMAQNRLKSELGPDTRKKVAVYRSAYSEYTLAAGDNKLDVALHWKNAKGLAVTKHFIFKRGDYLIDTLYDIDNQSQQPWKGRLYNQLKRQPFKDDGNGLIAFRTYTGGAVSHPEKHFDKVSFSSMKKKDFEGAFADGWVSFIQHYFLSAWVPPKGEKYHYYSRVFQGDNYVLGMASPVQQVAPGEKARLQAKLYAGPNIPAKLKDIAPHLDLAVDYGILWPFSQAIFFLMKHIHSILLNWGWSIIAVTLLIKLAFYPLSYISYRSMAKMRKLQPKMQALRERYGSDRQKMGQATMELYRKEKINPFGGCLPILVQIPIFIALYYVLIESVELRQAPFIFWIQDLSVKDPFYVLPLLMGASMLVQQKLSPAPLDPIQARVMMFMPLMMIILFLNFPAGLMVYWVANNILSISQQWYIMRKLG